MNYLNQRQIALMFETTAKTVRAWEDAGMPYEETDVTDESGHTRRTRLHDPGKVFAWLLSAGKLKGGVLKILLECFGEALGKKKKSWTWADPEIVMYARGYFNGYAGAVDWLANDWKYRQTTFENLWTVQAAGWARLEKLCNELPEDDTEA